jgi:GntR family carbon starvation induced transcriptional regulator
MLKPTSTLLESAGQATAASLVYQRLRSDILLGELKPGEKLRLSSLARHYEAGAIPLREALNRLSTEQLVSQHDRRGFYVCDVSEEDVIDLTQTRCWLYEGALRASIEQGGREWEDELVLSFYRLGELSRYENDDPARVNPAWMDPHRRFHTALIAACGSKRTITISENLFDQAERYRNLARLKDYKASVHEEHRSIMEAALRRDSDAAVAELLGHLKATCDTVVKALR